MSQNDDEGRLEEALRRHLPDDDPMNRPARAGRISVRREAGQLLVILHRPDQLPRTYSHDVEAEAVAVSTVEGDRLVTTVWRAGEQLHRRVTGPAGSN